MSAPNERSVTRTFRAAIRLGEDFITLEETITLPLDADDAAVQQAVDLGWRIYSAQREALSQQVASVRESQGHAGGVMVRDPDAPASEKQRNYIAALQEELTWSHEQLASYANEHQVDLVTMNKGQASGFIDQLKKIVEERPRYSSDQSRTRTSSDQASGSQQAASERQIQALTRLAEKLGIEFVAEIQQRFGITPQALSNEQASTLLNEWQRSRKHES